MYMQTISGNKVMKKELVLRLSVIRHFFSSLVVVIVSSINKKQTVEEKGSRLGRRKSEYKERLFYVGHSTSSVWG